MGEVSYCSCLTVLTYQSELKIVLGTPFVANVGNMRKSEDFAERDSLVRRCAAIVERDSSDYQTVFLPYNAMFDEIPGTAPASRHLLIWDGINPTCRGINEWRICG